MTTHFKTVTEAGSDASWLVMVHGMSQDHRAFSAQTEAFRGAYRLLLVDLPGHGLAADIPGPFGHRELAAHVGRALDDAGVSTCHYWATHTGTALGLLLAVDTPERFQSMVLEGAVLPGHPMASVERYLQQARQTARNHGVASAVKQWFDEGPWFSVMHQRPGECRAADHWTMVADFGGAPWLDTAEAEAVAPIDDRLAAIDIPVFVYNGEHDLADFVAAADRLQGLLPAVKRATIADAGGFPAWEFPETVNRLVVEFLGSTA